MFWCFNISIDTCLFAGNYVFIVKILKFRSLFDSLIIKDLCLKSFYCLNLKKLDKLKKY